MCELAAHVTSSLLPFPEVTMDALGEDEIRLDSVLHGKFATGKSGLAWLACGPHLEVIQATTGERFSAYRFSGVNENAPNVLAVHDFYWLKRLGLLVALEESAGSILCLYDLSISRVVKAVVIPGRITAIEPLVSYGGASTSTQHLHQSLRWFFGVVAVITDVGHVLLVDLCLDDPSCSQSELEASDLEVVNKSPAEIPHIRERVTQQGRHLCLQLCSPTGTSATALQYVTRTNQLAVGFSNGYLQLWNMKTLKKEYHSQLEGGKVPVYAFTFQEPENDPRNCCYLWAVQSTQDHEADVVSLHLLQLAFGERKCLALGKILYEGLEYCEERYSQDLNVTTFPSRAQATHTRLLDCQTIEKFRHHPDRDDSMNEGASPDTSVSIFSWQVKSYGQGRPTTYVGLFDINRWYHAQMPDSLRAGESLHNCPYMAVWSLDAVVELTSPCSLLDIAVHERTLSRGLPYTCPLPEQFFNPTTYNFDATCLLNSGIIHVTCSGYQKETLRFLKKSAPSLSQTIPDGYSRCLMSGLFSPHLVDVQPNVLSQEEQLDAILSTAVETSSLGLITGCIKQWLSEEQPGSAVNLRYILEWAWNKVVLAKEQLDGICAPLFDCSSNFTDPQTLQLLQHSQRLLGNLSAIFHCLLNEAHQLTQKGLVGLINKNVVSSLISQYAQVVLWFCRTGLLPEGSDDDVLQISRPFYNYPVIKNYYTGRREELQRLSRGKWCSDCLIIDGLVGQYAGCLGDLWKRDEGGTGQYPPPTLHALLDMHLLENMEQSAKHAVVIYLLLDVMYSLPNKSGTSIESFPTAFAIPIGLVKLVQGLWLLDHHDHENSVELLLHPATSRSLWAWQHGRVLQALMCQGQHAIALRYLHAMSPRISSTCPVLLCLSVLLHNRCIVEAWTLLRQHSNKLNMEELLTFLYETCLELGLMEEVLKLPLGLAEQDCLERFLQGSGGLQNRELLMVHYLQQANYVPALQLNQSLKKNLNDPKYKERSNTRNSILDQYGKVLPRVQRKLATERVKPYHHSSNIHKEVSRPQPLSTLPKRSAADVLTRASFLSNVLTKIGEVWEVKDSKPESSPLKSPRASGLLMTSSRHSSTDLAEAFVGTPVKMTSKRMTRILNLIVWPSAQTSPEGLGLMETLPPQVIKQGMPSPLPASSQNLRGTTELSLLQTPQVVKRARALAATGPVFPGFTPQSILRSSLRPTPVGSPSASPGRSTTPPPRPKESRITFEESKRTDLWTNVIPAANEICTSLLPNPGVEGWNGQPPEEEVEEEYCFTFVPHAQLEEDREREVGEVSNASTHYIDTRMELHEAPTPEDPEDMQQVMEEEVDVNVRGVVPEIFPLLPTCTEELDETPGEQEELEPNLEQVEVEFNPALEVAVPNLGIEVTGLNMGQRAREPHPEQCVVEPGPEQCVVEPGPEQGVVEPGPEQGVVEPGPEQGVVEHDPEQGVVEPGAEQGVVEQIPEKEEAQSMLEQATAPQTSKQGKSPEQEEVEQSLQQEEMGKCPEHGQMEPTGLDEFVERHLFGNDLSPPLTRSSIRQASQGWAASSYSECLFDAGKEAPVAVGSASPTLMTKKSSVSSSADITADSHSVVSLNDSEELSRASSEEEDSGSDVEIIEQLEGKECQQLPQDASLFQQEPPLGSWYLEEQATAMPSVVTPDVQLETVEAEGEEEEVDMTDLEAEGSMELMCYTELRPSDTLLVPLVPDDEQHLDLQKLEDAREPEIPYTNGPDGFTLEVESLENGLTGSIEGSSDPLLIVQLPQLQGTRLQQQVHGQDLICLDTVNADMSSLPARTYGLMTQTSEESAFIEQEGRELLHSVVSAHQETVICDTQLVEERSMLIESQGPGIATKESKASSSEDELEEERMKEESFLEEETACLVSAVEPGSSGQDSMVKFTELGPVMVELATVFEQAGRNIVEEVQPSVLVEEAVSRAVPKEALTGAIIAEAVTGAISGKIVTAAVGEEMVTDAVVEEAVTAVVVEEAVTGAIGEQITTAAVGQEMVTGAVVDQMVTSSVVEETVTSAVVEGAVTDAALEEAVTDATVEEALTDAAVEEAVTGAAVEGAVTDATVEEAVTDATVEGAVTGAAVEGAVTGAAVEGAVTDAAVAVAVTDAAVEVAVTDAAVEGAVTDAAVEGAVTDAAVEEALTGTVMKVAVTDAVDQEAVNTAVVGEAVTGAVVELVEPGAVTEEIKPVVIVKNAAPATEVQEMETVTLHSEPQLGVDVSQQMVIQCMEEAELHDTSVEASYSAGSKIRCAAAETRRMTRQRKVITFPSPIDEAQSNMQTKEEKLQHDVDSNLPFTPTRITRHTKHERDSQILLRPRRNTMIAVEKVPQKEDKAMVSNTIINSEPKSSKKQTPQNTLPRPGTQKTRNSHQNTEDIQDTEDSTEIDLLALPMTRSRKARKISASIMEVPGSETPSLLEAKEEALHRPGMMTRKSSRGLFLALETTQEQIVGLEWKGATPKKNRRTVSRSRAVEQDKHSSATAKGLPSPNFSRRTTRNSLSSHLAVSKGEKKAEHLVLDTSLGVEPGAAVANAPIGGLKDKGLQESGGMATSNSKTTPTRARRKGTRARSPPLAIIEAPNGTEELLLDRGLVADMKNQTQSQVQIASGHTLGSKASETDSSPLRDSLLSSLRQTRRKTKGKRADSPPQNDISQVAFRVPTTRTRQPAASTLSHTVNNEETGMTAAAVQLQTETAKPRKKHSTRRNVEAGSPPTMKIKLISPMASPTELAPGVEREEKGEAPLQRRNLRRKRLLETIFPKPVTRRKML
ncbi:hypothetical protein COCON_G00094220 [Conger conger]|uniref:Protein ELYS n=1 Tax=Conger conger TaxID=82655 RepID=A0A9Q1DLM1_CONCO|nr:hypothetical protein COCON_G00094220 [Conger conger]